MEAVKTWTTKDGRVISVAEMESLHLLNTIAMLLRIGARRQEIAIIQRIVGPKPQGDAAQDAWDHEYLAMEEEPLRGYLARTDPHWNALCDAASARFGPLWWEERGMDIAAKRAQEGAIHYGLVKLCGFEHAPAVIPASKEE